ncbi:MAG: DoxX family membrane protein [Deltaproteobacteria bacterium]|nr:MAG: DoxX family membrane protein [Deltaproteobacteria bacterium]TMB16085.1 MAG: DoxX family membrane protein [Deltaproteobacteria bacterium]
MKPKPTIAPFSIHSPRSSGARVPDKGVVEKPPGHRYRGAMLTPGFSLFLAVLRIAAGVSLFTSGLQKLSWFAQPPLQQKFAEWSTHPANDAVAKYLAFVSQYPAVFSRVVVVGELGLGALLILGLLTPLAALLALVMVLNFQFASGQIFSLNYVRGQSGLAYLMIYPLLFFGRAGTALGVDGLIARGVRSTGAPSM